MKIEVYSKDNCVFCDKAKSLLDKHSKQYTSHKLDQDFTRDEIIEMFPDARTFPIIVVDGTWIGGYNELVKLSQQWATDEVNNVANG